MPEIPPPDCEMGLTAAQVEQTIYDFGRDPADFHRWMHGQTGALCDGQVYHHPTRQMLPCCGGVAHGPVVYVGDLQRFLDRRPVSD